MKNKAISQFWEKYGAQTVAILLILLMIGLYFFIRFLVKLAKKPKNTPYLPVYEVNPQTGEVVEVPDADPLDGFKPDALVAELRTVLTTSYWFDASDRCEAFKKASKLKDNQLIALCNMYKNKHLTTLRQDMENTYGDGCTFFDSEFGDILRDKMTALDIP